MTTTPLEATPPLSLARVQRLRDTRFPELNDVAYLDYMGACPDPGRGAFWRENCDNDEEVGVGAGTSLKGVLGNPHSLHGPGSRSQLASSTLRRQVLAALGATEDYIVVFTSGTTGGCRLVAECLGAHPCGTAFYPHRLSHNSVLGMRGPLLRGCSGMSALPYGVFRNIDELCEVAVICGAPPTALVAFPLECNFSGEMFDTPAVSSNAPYSLHDAVTGVHETFSFPSLTPLVLVDGAAAVGKHPIALDGTGVDYFVFSFYKWFGAPTGLGALLVRKPTTGSTALNALLKGKTASYSGGGSVEFQLPFLSTDPLLGAPTHSQLYSSTSASGAPSSVKGSRNLQAPTWDNPSHQAEQGLEDGTPHFVGIQQASTILSHIFPEERPTTPDATQPPLFDPSEVEQRITYLRRLFLQKAFEALRQPSTGGEQGDEWPSWFYPLHPVDREFLLNGSVPVMGSSVAFVLISRPSTSLNAFPYSCVSHGLLERLVAHHKFEVCLRGGGFCNPGATMEFLKLSQGDIEDQLVVSGALPSGGSEQPKQGCSSKAVCWDDFSITDDGRPLGCLRVSFGLLSTVMDVGKAVEALVAAYSTDVRLPSAMASPGDEPLPPSSMANELTTLQVHSIYVYPVKGCQGFSLSSPGEPWPIAANGSGMKYDRQWCIARRSPDGSSHTVLTPKMNNAMSLIQTSIVTNLNLPILTVSEQRAGWRLLQSQLGGAPHSDDARYLVLKCPRQQTALVVPIDSQHGQSAASSAKVRGRSVPSVVLQNSFYDDVNAVLGNELGEPVMLMSTNEEGATNTNFSNSGGLLVVHLRSHERVIGHMLRNNPDPSRHVSLQSYRPNIVVENLEGGNSSPTSTRADPSCPFVELEFDSLRRRSNGEVLLSNGAPCHRCTQVGVDTATGQIKSEPLATIASICRSALPNLPDDYRMNVLQLKTANAVVFGQVFQLPADSVRSSHSIQVGEVLEATLRNRTVEERTSEAD